MFNRALFLASIGGFLMAGTLHADVVGPTAFGKTADGTAVESYTLKNKNGVTVKVMTLGATITEINVPDKAGKFANVVLGFDDVAGYESKSNQYFGCTVGRVANRIANGKFMLDGKEYKLAINNDPNHLHGGVKRSLDKVVWKAQVLKRAVGGDLWHGVRFAYHSPDGEEGYPGAIDFEVSFLLTSTNEVVIEYDARNATKATPINLTNHSYFNLAGAGAETVLDHDLVMNADEYIPVDKTLIPTGKREAVKGTVFEFSKATRIGERIETLYDTSAKGYDHCYVVRRSKNAKDPRPPAATLRDPKSGRTLTVFTTQPGIQLYTGNFLFGQRGAGGKEYRQRSGVCLETCHFPDAVNQPKLGPSIVLQPGSTYQHSTAFLFAAE